MISPAAVSEPTGFVTAEGAESAEKRPHERSAGLAQAIEPRVGRGISRDPLVSLSSALSAPFAVSNADSCAYACALISHKREGLKISTDRIENCAYWPLAACTSRVRRSRWLLFSALLLGIVTLL